MTARPWIVLVGGFLGAGKTSLLLAAGKELRRRGVRSAIILNDQGDALVDSNYAALHGLDWGEVRGGCFCCRFSDLVRVIDQVRQHAPDVIFAEPAGSCTDLSATVLRPLQESGSGFRIAPFTVLVDPQRAEALLRDNADAHLAYLFRRQMEEADLICFTKSDICPQIPAEIRTDGVRQISAKTGQGIPAWLNEVLAGDLSSGAHALDIDYEEYARAEAALAWLDLQVGITPRVPASPALILGPFLDRLDADLTAAGIGIVHLKAIAQAETGFVRAAICANGQQPEVEGMLDASPALGHELLLNLRALGEAGQVRRIVEHNLALLEAALDRPRIACFHPAPPRAERRLAAPFGPGSRFT